MRRNINSGVPWGVDATLERLKNSGLAHRQLLFGERLVVIFTCFPNELESSLNA